MNNNLFERFFNYFIKQLNEHNIKIYFQDIDEYGGNINILYNTKKFKMHFTKCSHKHENITIITTEWYTTEIITTKNYNQECKLLQDYIIKCS